MPLSNLILVLVVAVIAVIPSFLFLSQNSQTLLVLEELESSVEGLHKQLQQNHSYKVSAASVLECLRRKYAPQTATCWNELRRQAWVMQLNEWEKLPEEQLSKFRNSPEWDPFDIFTPTYECDANNLKRIGASGDGGKWICTEDYLKQDSCIVFSLGSNGQFDFEQAMQKLSGGACKIYTFDCTGVWNDPSTTFYPWCLGSSNFVDSKNRTYKSFSTLLKDLNINHISYLKMDIEGFEWQVFPELLSKGIPLAQLPKQISFELHVHSTTESWSPKQDLGNPANWAYPMIKLGKALDAAGYRIVVQERNILFKAGVEYVIIREEIKQ